jgi:predicted nuclease of predicted toxin-antitoxin system
MKFKLDENFGRAVQEVFRTRGHDAVTVRDEKLGGALDPRVLDAGSREGRILVTMDQDFANVLRYPPHNTHGVAVIRIPGRASLPLLATLVRTLLEALEKKQIKGRLWIVEPGRIREHEMDPWLDDESEEP